MQDLRKPEADQATTVILNSLDSRLTAMTTLSPGAEIIVGRSRASDLRIDAPMVSRRHCRIALDHAGQVTVEDLGSHNGTAVNGQRIGREWPLHDGDDLWLGILGFKVQLVQQGATVKFAARIRSRLRSLVGGNAGPNTNSVNATSVNAPLESLP